MLFRFLSKLLNVPDHFYASLAFLFGNSFDRTQFHVGFFTWSINEPRKRTWDLKS